MGLDFQSNLKKFLARAAERPSHFRRRKLTIRIYAGGRAAEREHLSDGHGVPVEDVRARPENEVIPGRSVKGSPR